MNLITFHPINFITFKFASFIIFRLLFLQYLNQLFYEITINSNEVSNNIFIAFNLLIKLNFFISFFLNIPVIMNLKLIIGNNKNFSLIFSFFFCILKVYAKTPQRLFDRLNA